MTIDEIAASEKLMLTAGDIAELIGSNPATIRLTVKIDPEALAPLHPIRIGNRVKFPKEIFLEWYGKRNGLE